MLLPRKLYDNAPPEARTRMQNNPTLLFSWWCTIFSAVIILFRLSGRFVRNARLFREDKIMALSLVPLLARMGFVHVVLIYGTNNVQTEGLTGTQIHRRELGAKMVLGARIFYALFIWTAKLTVTEFLKRMTERFWKRGYELGLQGIRIFLAVTFCAVLIATLSECQPFHHYWQVTPDPGPKCRQGYAHLLTMGITDIVTDILIVFFPIPIIIKSAMPLKRKVSLVLLFSMSLILIGITAARIPSVVNHRGLQQFRTVFASAEILAATAVSNAIILGSFLRDRGIKKAKYKFGSTTDSMERRSSTRRPTLQQWGSDEDLVHDLGGYRLGPDLAEQRNSVPRPAPVADIEQLTNGVHSQPFASNNWKFPDRQSKVSRDSEESDLKATVPEEPLPSPRTSKIVAPSRRNVSFFDVGGLLEEGSPHSNTAPSSPAESAIVSQDFAQQPRRGSRAFLSDIGGLLITTRGTTQSFARRSSRVSQSTQRSDTGSYEMSSRSPVQVQDAGGLLSNSPQSSPPPPSSLPSSSPPQEPTVTPSRTGSSPVNATTPDPPIEIRSPSLTARQDTEQSLQDVGGLLSSKPSES